MAHLAVSAAVSAATSIGDQPRNRSVRANRRLMLAVLNEALQTYATGLTSRSPTKRCDAYKAETWILSDATDHAFAFANVCSVLGVDPDYIRGRMRRLRLTLFKAEGPAN
jgi:hypothetical protein